MFNRNRLRLISCVVMLAAALCGCGGDSTAVDAAFAPLPGPAAGLPTALPLDHLQPWESLDAQGQVAAPADPPSRQTASINANTEFAAGVERYLENGDVTDCGEASTLQSGSAGSKEVSWAMYRLSLGTDQPGAVAVDVNLRRQRGGTSLSGYYLGLSNYRRSRWEWHGPYTDHHVRVSTGAQVRAGMDYTSLLGDIFLCVAAYDGANFDLVGLGANRFDPADATAPPVPGGLTAEPVAGGLRLQWNAVLASDLAGYRVYWRSSPFIHPTDPGVATLDYLEGAPLHQLNLAPSGAYSVAVSAVDLSGNESAMSLMPSASPLPGSPPALLLSLSAASARRGDPVTLTALGAANYSFDLNGDGVIDESNSTGSAGIDTSATGIIRPLVIGEGADSTVTVMGGVSLIVTGNTRPAASATADPQSGKAPLGVYLTGEAQDLEDTPSALSYAWDFNGDGTYEPSTNTLTPPPYNYSHSGVYNVRFRVTDSAGAWGVASVAVNVQPGNVNSTLIESDVSPPPFEQSAALVGGLMAIAYNDSSVYYTRSLNTHASAWTEPLYIASSDGLPGGVKLVVANGKPAIAWCNSVGNCLYYCQAEDSLGTTWGTPINLGGNGVTLFFDMVIAAGCPGIAYYNANDTRPYFVRATDADGAAWGAPVAVDGAGRGYRCAVAIVNGFPAMVYSNTTSTEVYYVQATQANGRSWGAPVTLLTAVDVSGLDLLEINARASVAVSDLASSKELFMECSSIDGTDWNSIQEIPTAGTILPGSPILAVFDGHPAIAFGDGSRSQVVYCEAMDSLGRFWQLPCLLAPLVPGDEVRDFGPLMNLGGMAAIGCEYYEESSGHYQLGVFRYYR